MAAILCSPPLGASLAPWWLLSACTCWAALSSFLVARRTLLARHSVAVRVCVSQLGAPCSVCPVPKLPPSPTAGDLTPAGGQQFSLQADVVDPVGADRVCVRACVFVCVRCLFSPFGLCCAF